MPRKLQEAVVVVTGASSGIGRATAHEFANKGSSLVLAARSESELQEVVAECEQRGAKAVAVPTDVTDEAAVLALSQRAIDAFGRIDVWVNNAAVSFFGKLHEVPMEDFRRVFETNVFGYVHGARAVIPVFREQGSGVLINVSSLVARMPQPYTSAYTMSKHAVRALGMSLRQELVLDKQKNVHVSTVLPATIDTPFFQHAANYTGRTPKAMPPVYPPENVARMIVEMAQHPKREVYVGNIGRLMNMQMKFMPAMTERASATMVDREHLADTPSPSTTGNLYAPMPALNDVRGGWKDGSPKGTRAAKVGMA
ncbi:MAG TPA: SDR family oxidoreductase, partial [Thermomicrobiales bacterium]|nr:SDR family oxidoreductase [Thermomicrobiales bacterium]